MNYRILYLVSVIVFLSLSTANIIVLSSGRDRSAAMIFATRNVLKRIPIVPATAAAAEFSDLIKANPVMQSRNWSKPDIRRKQQPSRRSVIAARRRF